MISPETNPFPPPLEDLRGFAPKYEERFRSRMRTNLSFTRLTLGHNGAKLLLCLCQRSRLIHSDLLRTLDCNLVAAAYLCARAHVEVTGTCGCLLYYLRRHYCGELDFEETDAKLTALSLGGISFPDRTRHPNAPNPIRVGEQIKKADAALSNAGDPLTLSKIYGFLSEYCHPNMLGTHLGVRLSESEHLPKVTFDKRIEFQPVDLMTILNGACASCVLFFKAYDEAFSLLHKNEEMPHIDE